MNEVKETISNTTRENASVELVKEAKETTSNTTDTETLVQFVDEEIDFDNIVEQTLNQINEGEIITGKVTDITKDFIVLNLGYKSEGQVPKQEFKDDIVDISVGDNIEVYLENLEDSDGQVVVSWEKAQRIKVWEQVGKVYDEDTTIIGVVDSRIKGGLSVDIGLKAFLPGSQVDLRPIKNLDKLIGERFEFKVLKYNQKRGNIVLSRRAILELDREDKRKKILSTLTENEIVKGYVKNITDYGIFVDLGGIDGLLHITDMTWGRIVHPSEMYNIGDEIEVIVLKFDPEDEKVSLGLKQKKSNPWDNVISKYPIGIKVEGKIVSLTNYGAFIELEEGVEGLIHISEMSWVKKIRQPGSLVKLGDQVEVIVKDIDVEKKRISLSMKEVTPNPWQEISDKKPVGSVLKGTIRNITDFGIFVGLDEGVDGLVHISDVSWNQREKSPSELYKKGQEITVKILSVDIEKERLSLGIKQLVEDPWANIETEIALGSEIKGKVVHIADFGIFVEIREGVEGLVHVSEIEGQFNKKMLLRLYPIESEIKAKVIKVDAQERKLGLTLTEEFSQKILEENQTTKENIGNSEQKSDEQKEEPTKESLIENKKENQSTSTSKETVEITQETSDKEKIESKKEATKATQEKKESIKKNSESSKTEVDSVEDQK